MARRKTQVTLGHGTVRFVPGTMVGGPGIELNADCQINNKIYNIIDWNRIDRAARIALGEVQPADTNEYYEVK